MNKYTKFVPLFAGLLLFPGTQLYAIDGTNTTNLVGTKDMDFDSLSSAKLQKMYLLDDTKIFAANSVVSSVLETQLRGTQVSIMSVEGQMCKVLSQNGKIGYVDIDELTSQPEYIFIPENIIMYGTTDTVFKTLPSDKGEDVSTAELNQEIQLTGSNEEKYWRVSVDGTTYYVDHETLNTQKTFVPTQTVDYSTSISWDGSKLNPSNGSIIGPSGKETYYNLNMNGVVSIMRGMGNNDEYWVREDGVKMLGDYVMVAASLDIRPRGSLVNTSLGMGIVCDTGGFAYGNPTQIDIAVAW